ncbi:MAG TPA: hypothetical protein VJN18_20415 [Polyangiaceae bacterium]|nr:hypothetical protein [Polyangiaceae bacterium]
MRATLFSTLTLTVAIGCGYGENLQPTAPGDAPGGSGNTSGGQPTGLLFQDSATDLIPRQQVTLTVEAKPPGVYSVRFALPKDTESDPLDAVLEHSAAVTDATGQASVMLTAPSTNAMLFRVRASIGGDLSVERDFTVTDAGSVKVRVQPFYPRDTREEDITTWNASARRGETCADHPSIPVPDGSITGVSAKMETPVLHGVWTGVPVAITLRSGHFVGGCTSIEMFRPGPPEMEHVVDVTVLNRPIELAQSNVDVSLQLDPEDQTFQEVIQAAAESALTALRGPSTDDADALLDAMRNTLDGEARQNLDAARKAEGWDDLVRVHWGTATRLNASVSGWLARGRVELASSQELLQGRLSAIDAKSAELTLLSAASLSPSQAGFVGSALVSWSAEADDTIGLATDLYLSGSRLASGLAALPALDDFPAAQTPEQALALALDCSGLSSVLAAAGSDNVLAYPLCNSACLTERCEQAAEALWQRASDATSTKPLRLALTAAGRVTAVGDAAEIEGITGSWVGELTGFTQSTGGPLVGSPPDP